MQIKEFSVIIHEFLPHEEKGRMSWMGFIWPIMGKAKRPVSWGAKLRLDVHF